METFIDRLRFLSKVHAEGKSSKFADFVGISRSSMTRYLAGDLTPKQDTLIAIRQKTGCDLNWLITGEGLVPDEGAKVPQAKFDQGLLRDVLLAIDLEMEAQGITLKPEKKAEAASILYEMFLSEPAEHIDRKRIGQLLKLAS